MLARSKTQWLRRRRLIQRVGTRSAVMAVAVALAVTLLDGALVGAPATASPTPGGEPYLVGRGLGDVTGEAADAGMLGYADLSQSTAGIHQRLRARTFIIADQTSGKRILHTTVDTGLMFQSVHDEVLRRLAARYGDQYTDQNVMLTATHTHSGVGGAAGHGLYNVTTLGFRPKTFEAQVSGIVDSVAHAQQDLRPAQLSLTHSQLNNASANRSRQAFDLDPAQDRAHFPDAVDPLSTSLQVTRGGRLDGVINWFPVHGTNMSVDNHLISGDNKGYAAYDLEREQHGVDYLSPDDPAFVSSFPQSNSGDMTANLDLHAASGEQQFANVRDIGGKQAAAAQAQSTGPGDVLGGGIDTRTVYVDLSNVTVSPEYTGDGKTHHTCAPVLGAAFAAGSTEDGGGGVSLFKEGLDGNPIPQALSQVIYALDPALGDCQAPKELLLPVGLVPGAVANTYAVQLFRIGDFYLLGLPTEPTIVSGLRLRQAVAASLGVSSDHVRVQGYTNGYAHYLATPEEYDSQQYEGAATMFGRWELPALQQTAAGLGSAMKAGTPVDSGRLAPVSTQGLFVAPTGQVLLDTAPTSGFGSVLTQPAPAYEPGSRAEVVFAGANPNNNLHDGGTFLTVERQDGAGWTRVADDGDWGTRFNYRHDGFTGSTIDITWDIPPSVAPGTYRITYSGDAKAFFGPITPFTGASRTFTVG